MFMKAPLEIDAKDIELNPILSHEGGFYHEAFMLSITPKENTEVYYTLDGSKPNKNSMLYIDPIYVQKEFIEADGSEIIISETSQISGPLSMIVTSDKNWVSPKEDIFKATVLRVIAYEIGSKKESEILTHTYFVDDMMSDRYTFPIFSITSDPSNLYDYESGINIQGKNYKPNPDGNQNNNRTGNYFMTGDQWEREIHLEFYDTNGILQMSQDAGIRIHGGLSRKYPIKSYRLYARREYDEENTFNYPFFEDKDIDSFKRLVLRNGGQAYQYSFFGEAFAQSLLKPLELDIQYSTPIILFVNGEYFGIRNVRDRFDVNYLESHYGIDESRSTILTGHAYLEDGSRLGQAHYQALYTYANLNDLSNSKHFKHIERSMDIDNYIDYMISEIYFGNIDWPQNNILYWRKNTTYNPNAPYGHDGRWRWMINDLDGSFAISFGTVSPTFNSFERLTGENWKTGKLFVNLLENEQFKGRFTYRMLELLDTIFDKDRVSDELDQMTDLYKPEMEEHINRYGYPTSYETWLMYVERMRAFSNGRKDQLITFMEAYLGLDTKHQVNISYDDEKGSIEVGHIKDHTGSYDGSFYHDLPISIQAVQRDGYHFKGWYYNEMQISDDNLLIISPEMNLNLYAVFETGEIPQTNNSEKKIILPIIFSIITLSNSTYFLILIKKKKNR